MKLEDKIFNEARAIYVETGQKPTLLLINPYTAKNDDGRVGFVLQKTVNGRPKIYGMEIFLTHDIEEGEILVK